VNQPLYLQQSVGDSIELLRMMEPKEGYYLAFSGGKDSVVIYRLAQMAGVKFDAHYNVTTVDHPELIRFIRSTYPTVTHERVKDTMWTLIPKRLMPPTRLARYCCEVLKEGGGEGRVVVMGVRWAESARRRKAWRPIEPCSKKGTVKINPILFWTDDEVWQFIHSENIPYCSLYDKGYKRLGCIGCPMSHNKRKELEANPKFRDAYLRAFGRMIEERKKRGLDKGVEGHALWDTPEHVMEWWLSR
jgi:phosphoadenosine phosphosulfate reductase